MALNNIDHRFKNFPLAPDVSGRWVDFDSEEDEALFTKTALASGTGVVTVDENHGIYRQSGAATTDNSGSQIQLDMEPVSLNAGKTVLFMMRGGKCSDGTQDEFFTGLAITDTTLLDGTGTLAGGLTHTDSIGFYKPDGESNVYGVIRRDSVQLATGAYAMTMTNYNVYAMRIEMDPSTAGKGRVIFYVNGTEIGRLDSTTMPYDAEEILAPSIAFVTGDASGTKTCDHDFIGWQVER